MQVVRDEPYSSFHLYFTGYFRTDPHEAEPLTYQETLEVPQLDMFTGLRDRR